MRIEILAGRHLVIDRADHQAVLGRRRHALRRRLGVRDNQTLAVLAAKFTEIEQALPALVDAAAALPAVHLAITNLAACLALLIPIAVTIAQAAHLNPLVCGLVVTLAVDAVILYPVQTASNLLAYEAGYFDTADVRRLGGGMLVLTILVLLLVVPYWSLLGLPLTI